MIKEEGLMKIFDSNVVMARGYTFSDDEIRRFRIKAVYNSSGDIDYMESDYIDDFVHRNVSLEGGEGYVMESAIRFVSGQKVLVKVVSLIVFDDVESMELYVLAHQELYLSTDRTLGGKMN